MSYNVIDLIEYYDRGLVSRDMLLESMGLSKQENDRMPLISKTDVKTGDLVTAKRPSRLASSLADLKQSKWMETTVNIGTTGVILEEFEQGSLVGQSNVRALKVLTPLGPGWTWDGIWAHQDVTLK